MDAFASGSDTIWWRKLAEINVSSVNYIREWWLVNGDECHVVGAEKNFCIHSYVHWQVLNT